MFKTFAGNKLFCNLNFDDLAKSHYSGWPRKKRSRVARDPARKSSRMRRTSVVRRKDEGYSATPQMDFLRSYQF
jgi:hypothetical protein